MNVSADELRLAERSPASPQDAGDDLPAASGADTGRSV
jgi:hypothetical protein